MKYNIFQGEKVRLRAETASDIEEKKRKILESEYDTESDRLCDTIYLPYSVESRIDGWESDVKRFNTWEFCRLIIGSYTLYIGKPKPSVDISEYTLVNDSIEFKKQRNYYTFTPKRNGTYYFGFTNIPEGYKYEVNVYNPGGENLTFGNLYRTYATLSLTNGQPYTIVVSDYGYHGDYSLITVSKKKLWIYQITMSLKTVFNFRVNGMYICSPRIKTADILSLLIMIMGLSEHTIPVGHYLARLAQ